MLQLENVTCIGSEVAIKWNDGTETYVTMEKLRALSPSAENMGETDLLGKKIGGGDGSGDFSEVTVTGWHAVGSYALRFEFSDGHSTGIYAWEYLRKMGEE